MLNTNLGTSVAPVIVVRYSGIKSTNHREVSAYHVPVGGRV
jgi:hypothetical protein